MEIDDPMRFESRRLDTFRQLKWPSWSLIPCEKLAKAGFYYAGTGDEVICFSCGGKRRGWKMSDRAIAVHSSNFPLCSFVRGDPECGNVPLTNFRTTTITPPVPTQPVRPPVQPNLIDFGAEEIVGGEIETATEGMEDISEPTDHQYNADMSDGPGPSRLVSTPSQGQNDLMASSSSRQFVSFTPDAEYEAAGTRFQALVAPTDHTSQSQIGRRPTQKRPIPQGESTSSAARRRSPDSDRFHISPQLREQLRIEMGAENQPEETPPTRQQTYGDQMRHRLRVALGGEDSPEEMPPSRHRTNSDHLRERLRLEFGVAEHPTDDVSSNSQSRLDIIERRSPRRPIPVSPPSVPQLVESGPTRLRLLPGGNRIPFGFGRGTTVTRLSQPNLPSNSLELDGEAEWQNIFSRIEGLANVLGVTDRDAKRSGAASPQDEIVRRQMDEMNIFTDTPNRPDLASYSTRLQTFTGIWATSKSQTAADMAAAGFYCTNDFNSDDSVKCFQCEVTLHNWLDTDDPWVEHARWSKRCQFVLMTKGRQFVAMVKNKFKSPRPDDSGNIADESEEIWQGGTETSSSAPTDPFVPQTLADLPQLNNPKAEQITQALSFGYEENLIVAAIFDNGCRLFPSVLELTDRMEAVRGKKEEKLLTSQPQWSGGPPQKFNTLAEENHYLRELRMCKICMDAEVSVVFLPCGHLVCCPLCSPALQTCPICREKVKGRVRSFVA